MIQLIKRQDWLLNTSLLFLIIASLTMLYSISVIFFKSQLIWFSVAITIIFLSSFINWQSLMNYRWIILIIYFGVILLLILTLLFAPIIRSSKSWLILGPIRFQVSEFVKVALILILAYFFSRKHLAIAHWHNILKSLFYFLIPAGLILLQPDLGAFLILFSIWLGFLLVSGIRWRHLLIGVLILIFLSIASWNYFLKDYQKERLRSFLNPEYSPLEYNYGVIQSKIAIGSAGFFGKGFKQGTQIQLGFLPEAQNDFIIAAVIEEWGLLGGFLTISALIFLILRVIKIGLTAENNFIRLLCLGTTILFLSQFYLNTGSVLGLLPVVGVSFPFLSYGGSSLIASAILIGIIQGIVTHSSFFKE